MATESGRTVDQKPADDSDAAQRSPQEIQAEIEASRAELGDTVAELAEKADVKEQTKRKIEATKADLANKKDELAHETRQAAQELAAQARQVAHDDPGRAVAAAFVGGLVIGSILWHR